MANIYPIDFDRFDRLLAKRGLTYANVARMIGYSRTAFAKARNVGKFSKRLVDSLSIMCSIKYKDYCPRDEQIKKPDQAGTGIFNLHVVIPQKLHDDLKELASANQMSVVQYVKDLLTKTAQGDGTGAEQIDEPPMNCDFLYNVIYSAVTKGIKDAFE